MMANRLAILGCASAIVFSGCTTADPFTREEQAARAQRNALLGAAAGAAAGLITGDSSMERKKRAIVGAGIGALAGGGVGAYMDRQEARLRQALDQTGVSVTRTGDNITLNMPGNITFATDSANLNSGFYNVLNSVALVLDEYEQTVIEVAGHTDNTGTDTYNQALSERRAGSVADYLVTREILRERIIEVGMGEQRPVRENTTDAGRQANRRVELTLVPLTLS